MNKRIRKKKGIGEFAYIPHYTPAQLIANAIARETFIRQAEEVGMEEFVKRLKRVV